MGVVPGEGRAAELFKILVKACRDLHKVGIVHRDLKPENIFVPLGHRRSFRQGLKRARPRPHLCLLLPESDNLMHCPLSVMSSTTVARA